MFYVHRRFPENSAVCEIISKKYGGTREAVDDNIEARSVLDNKDYTSASTRPLPCTYTPPPAPHTHPQKYVTLIAFPLQQWFLERASAFLYT
jgi:hypothetical protein